MTKTNHAKKAPTKGPVTIKLTYVIIGAIVVIVAIYASSYLKPVPDLEEFAQCLNDEGAVMYGTFWCSHCQAQKAKFGDSFEYVKYVECSEEMELCTDEGIEGYPTWKIDGQSYPGVQPMGRLAELTGCQLPK